MLDCDQERKDTQWALTHVNVRWIVWFEWFSVENTYTYVFPKMSVVHA